MAYTVTMEFTRPNEETAMVTMASMSGGEAANTTTQAMLESVGLTKTFEVDGLVVKVIYTAADKAAYETARDSIIAENGTTVNPSTGIPTAYLTLSCISKSILRCKKCHSAKASKFRKRSCRSEFKTCTSSKTIYRTISKQNTSVPCTDFNRFQ